MKHCVWDVLRVDIDVADPLQAFASDDHAVLNADARRGADLGDRDPKVRAEGAVEPAVRMDRLPVARPPGVIAQAGAVVAALTLVAATGNTIFDPIAALLLAVYLLWTAGRVFTAAIDEIMDVRLPEREERLIQACIEEHRGGGIRGYHHLRTRKSGRQRYVDLHLLFDPQETVAGAHELCDRVEAAIHARLPGALVTIHLEPDDGRDRGPWREERPEEGEGDR